MKSETRRKTQSFGRQKKGNFVFQAKATKDVKRLDGSIGYFQDPFMSLLPTCCFLKLDDDHQYPQKDRSLWIKETFIECHWSEQQTSFKDSLGFGLLVTYFSGLTPANRLHRAAEVIELIAAKHHGQTKTNVLSFPREYPLSTEGLGYLIYQRSKQATESQYWNIEFRESCSPPYILEMHITAFRNRFHCFHAINFEQYCDSHSLRFLYTIEPPVLRTVLFEPPFQFSLDKFADSPTGDFFLVIISIPLSCSP
jgi:hypothetical protein